MKSEDDRNNTPFDSGDESCALPQDEVEAFYSRRCPEKGEPYDKELLVELVGIMKDSEEKRAARPKRTRTMPSGFVYLGQFIDHDLTRDGRHVAEAKPDVDHAPNNRTPRLDLDHLYGKEPSRARCLYDDKGHLLLGDTLPVTGWPTGFDDLHRLQDGAANVIDPRNDENLIIAQMHVLWSKLHNRFIDLLPKRPEISEGVPGATLFERARMLVTWHYQWIVWNDFLPHIVRKCVFDEVKANHLRLYARGYTPDDYPVALPIEFTMAAFRFGHSMVQENYRLNQSQFVNVQTILKMTKPGGGIETKLPSKFVIDWRFFFTDTMINFGQNIDTYITEALYDLDMGTVQTFRTLLNRPKKGAEMPFGGKFALPEMTLTRGSNACLPSGEQFARFFKYPVLSPSQIYARPQDQAFFQKDGIRGCTPLWYYLLREAAVEEKPEPATDADATPIQKLGTIGSRIVAEVISQVLSADANSIFNAGKHWQPPFIKPESANASFRLNSMAAVVRWIQIPF
jgi:hypothetical protein